MKILTYIALFLSTLSWGQESSIDLEFKNANSLYEQGNYKEAVSGYEKILQRGVESGELYFNLGNAYYKLNKTAPSIYNYEKALIISPNDQSIVRNLEFAKKTLIDEITVVEQLGRRVIIHNALKTYSYDTWAWMGVGCSFLIFICFVFYYLANNVSVKRLFFCLMIISLLSTIFNVSAGFYEFNYDKSIRPGIIFAEKVDFKSKPKNSSQTLFSIHEGVKVFVLEEKSLWARVKLNNQKEGWIKKETFKEIKKR